jgi:hypothetical protein
VVSTQSTTRYGNSIFFFFFFFWMGGLLDPRLGSHMFKYA